MQLDYVPEQQDFYNDDENDGPHDTTRMMPLHSAQAIYHEKNKTLGQKAM
jgi:hypothetical protein